MFNRKIHSAIEYTDEQRRRHELWLIEGDGPGHYRKSCQVCAEVFYSVQRNARFCSLPCYHWSYRRPPRPCAHCGQPFQRSKRAKYCGDPCKQAAWRERRARPSYYADRHRKPSESSGKPQGRILIELL